MDEAGWERYELHGKKVYQLDVCEAIHDRHLCPGVTLLKAGEHELGPVFCNCPCHKKPDRVESLISSLLSRFDRPKPRPLAALSDIRDSKSSFE